MWAWPSRGRNGHQPREDGAGLEVQGEALRQRQEGRRESGTENQGRKTWREVDKKHGREAWGWAGARQGQGQGRKRRSKGRRAQSPQHRLLSLTPNPLCPHPRQDAVSMTTWPGRKGGWGLQRKFSTSAEREEVECRKEGAGQGEGPRGPGTPSPRAHCPGSLTHPHLANLHPLRRRWATVGRGEGSGEDQGSNVQRSATAQAWRGRGRGR